MAVEVSAVGRRKGMIEGSLGTIGSAVGSIWGPIGGAVGGAVGGMASGEKDESAVGGAASGLIKDKIGGSSSVDRRKEGIQNVAAIDKGMNALKNNPDLANDFAPVLADARERAIAGEVQNRGYTGVRWDPNMSQEDFNNRWKNNPGIQAGLNANAGRGR